MGFPLFHASLSFSEFFSWKYFSRDSEKKVIDTKGDWGVYFCKREWTVPIEKFQDWHTNW